MKRKALMKDLVAIAKAKGLELKTHEGARHTKVTIGNKTTTVPRHSEINEYTAKDILKYLEEAEAAD